MIKFISAVGAGTVVLGTFAGATLNPDSQQTTAFASVEVLEEGSSEWQPVTATAGANRMACDINFRGSNSGSRTIWVDWRESEARIPSGWWARIGPQYATVQPAGLLRENQTVNTSCKVRRRYRVHLIYDANGDRSGMHEDPSYDLYRPSATDWYDAGTTTVNLGDLYARFK